MLNVKNARLRSEHDVQLLRNRLERLRQEERKALKKIEETRRRADQIVALKTRNEENHMRKALEADYANKQMQRARQRLQGTREGQAEAIRQNLEMVKQQKKAEADTLRQQRALIQGHLASKQSQHVARAQQINQVRWSFSMTNPTSFFGLLSPAMTHFLLLVDDKASQYINATTKDACTNDARGSSSSGNGGSHVDRGAQAQCCRSSRC